ncbi:PREDICTED: uncharacterized protein LOC109146685 [Ipomoea nil]|uniref:uncharacterized protein LOC109146685 n=1 Tax=Ipomoea nil TaxID=35883 RepID=UPI000901C415|nr:PREDICTED: uncharacterized protein LOC109146685 [Ipomoea nil]
MDINAIASGCAVLSLSEEDVGGLEAPDIHTIQTTNSHHDLVGRFLTDRPIKFDHMQQVLASVWRPVMGMRVLPMDDNLIVFQFPHLKDLQRVIDDGPWSFENQTLVCATVPTGIRPDEVLLTGISIWVQIHDLPTIYASSDFIARIGDYVGTFLAADPHNFGGSWHSFFRIRVRLEVQTPLKRRMKMHRKDGTVQWINFKYERLGTFCFCCGVLGHSEKFCRKVYEEGVTPEEYPYGAWMRAGARRQARPIGAKWLLADLPQTPTVMQESIVGEKPRDVTEIEEASGIQGELKRRREGSSVEQDVVMFENPKNSSPAGLTAQTRPTQ